jgi:hypothetical protein
MHDEAGDRFMTPAWRPERGEQKDVLSHRVEH